MAQKVVRAIENLIEIINLIFRKVSASEILSSAVQYDNLTHNNFISLTNSYISHYSRNECTNLYDYLYEEVKKWRRIKHRPGSGKINVLEVLSLFGDTVLKEIQGAPVCTYENLLRWRKISFDLDEDLFTTSFLAVKDYLNHNNNRTNFKWKVIIEHDNVLLMDILKRGMAENHFHLKGSAPHFSLSWVNLMNDVARQRFDDVLEFYDKHRLDTILNYNANYSEDTLVIMRKKASLIRAFLYARLNRMSFELMKYKISLKDYISELAASSITKDKMPAEEFTRAFESEELKYQNRISLPELLRVMESEQKKESFLAGADMLLPNVYYTKEFFEQFQKGVKISVYDILLYSLRMTGKIPLENLKGIVSPEIYQKITHQVELKMVQKCLGDNQLLESVMINVDMFIGMCKSEYILEKKQVHPHFNSQEETIYDYAGLPLKDMSSPLVGERWFLYTMFKKLYKEKPDDLERIYGNLFYAYLVIKERIRSELIQINDKVGFDNFLRYQDRKEEFIDDTVMSRIYNKLAVMETLKTQPVMSLEARIAPRMDAIGNKRYIARLDKEIGQYCPKKGTEDKRYFYVFHFIKEADMPYQSAGTPFDKEQLKYIARHIKKRNQVQKQARSIAALRENYPEEASRVLGIDAASSEIVCRPEVFAQAFRYLRNHDPGYDEYAKYRLDIKILPKLRVTYHVGEDFLDIVDGMRAVDEAIHFLDFASGDRLGHALAIGIPPREWYDFKNSTILITKQDYLDNVAWVYGKIREYHIEGCENMIFWLQSEFHKYFTQIYLNHITRQEEVNLNEQLQKTNAGRRLISQFLTFSIDDYYNAWKLRGDNPSRYYNYIFHDEMVIYGTKPERLMNDKWQEYDINKHFPENYELRYEPQIAFLYYLYHYNAGVKTEGSSTIEIKVDSNWIKAASHIQYVMQKKILEKGIGIETNPSSNYLISTFKRYDNHPILHFNNRSLGSREERDGTCLQLMASINTDDQGVFGTSLENEYALMALALEKCRDEKGELRYRKNDIYRWVDNIRQIGMMQSFVDGAV